MRSVEESRKYFPRGLSQPEGSYRFGLDALLLAGFALQTARDIMGRRSSHKTLRIVEPGCGCGAAIIAISLEIHSQFLGLDREQDLIDAAMANAVLLGVEDRVQFCQASLAEKSFFSAFAEWGGKCDLVLANPPWLRTGSGAMPLQTLRRSAICAESNTLELFCQRASGFLKTRGFFCGIIPPALLCEFYERLKSAGLGLRKIWPVMSHTGEGARRVLILSQKNSRSEPAILSPLILREKIGQSKNTGWTRAAMSLCPWLAGGGSNPACV